MANSNEEQQEKIPARKVLAFAAGMGILTTGIFGSPFIGIGTSLYLSPGDYLRNHPEASYVMDLRYEIQRVEIDKQISLEEKRKLLEINNSILERVVKKTPDFELQIKEYYRRQELDYFLPWLLGCGALGLGIIGGSALVNYSLDAWRKKENDQ